MFQNLIARSIAIVLIACAAEFALSAMDSNPAPADAKPSSTQIYTAKNECTPIWKELPKEPRDCTGENLSLLYWRS
jgi:hypothetical protein